jgi:hypothetical protein
VANLSVIRAAMAAQIGRLASPSIRSFPEPEDQINPPCAYIMPGRPYVNYVTTLEGASGFGGVMGAPVNAAISPTNFNLDCLIILSHASTLERVTSGLDAWLGFEADSGAVSIPAAVAADPTLGGTVAWCEVTTCDPPGPMSWSGPEMFGCRMHFQLSAL